MQFLRNLWTHLVVAYLALVHLMKIVATWWWSLYLHQPLSAALVLIFFAVLLVALAALILRFIRPVSAIVIKSFESPTLVSTRFGVTGKTVANLLADEIHKLIHTASALADEAVNIGLDVRASLLVPLLQQETLVQGVEVEVKGVSVTKLLSVVLAIRQRQSVITGDLMLGNGKVTIRLRARSDQCWEASGELGKTSLVALCSELACKVLEHFSPAVVGFAKLDDSPTEAGDAFRRWIRREPSNAYAHLMLASSIDDQWTSLTEKDEKARIQEDELREIDAALRIKPNMPEALFAKAYFLEQTGPPDKAVAAYGEVLKRRPKFLQALLYFGDFLAKQDRKTEAIVYLDKARSLLSGSSRPLTNLADAYLSAEADNIAIELFQEALKVDPTYEAAKEGLKRARQGLALRKPA